MKIVCSFQECFNHLFYTIWACSSFRSLWSRFEHYIASLRLSEHNMADVHGRPVCWSEGVPVWGHTVSMKTYEASRQTDKTAFWIISFRDRFHGCLSRFCRYCLAVPLGSLLVFQTHTGISQSLRLKLWFPK